MTSLMNTNQAKSPTGVSQLGVASKSGENEKFGGSPTSEVNTKLTKITQATGRFGYFLEKDTNARSKQTFAIEEENSENSDGS